MPGFDGVTDQRLAAASAGNIPAGFVLSFFQRFQTEQSGAAGAWDGHVLEYSLDGTTWTDILAGQGTIPANANRFLLNGYNRTFNSSGNPLAGRRCWSGDQLTFQEVRVDMADFAGRDVSMRIRFATDGSVADVGVWIDDITFRLAGSCTVPSPSDLIFKDGFEAGSP